MSAFEKGIEDAIRSYLESLGAVVYKIHGGQFQSSISDLLICYKGRFLAIEVKGPEGHLRPGQRVRIRKLKKASGVAISARNVERVKQLIDDLNAGRFWDHDWASDRTGNYSQH